MNKWRQLFPQALIFTKTSKKKAVGSSIYFTSVVLLKEHKRDWFAERGEKNNGDNGVCSKGAPFESIV